MNRNVPFVGFIIGMLLPILGFFIMFKLWGTGTTFKGFFVMMNESHKTYAKVLTMSLLINLAPFLYYKTKKLGYAMNGVVVATMLYSVYIVLLMFVW